MGRGRPQGSKSGRSIPPPPSGKQYVGVRFSPYGAFFGLAPAPALQKVLCAHHECNWVLIPSNAICGIMCANTDNSLYRQMQLK